MVKYSGKLEYTLTSLPLVSHRAEKEDDAFGNFLLTQCTVAPWAAARENRPLSHF